MTWGAYRDVGCDVGCGPVTWGGHSASRSSENRYFPTFFDWRVWVCPRHVTPHVTTPPLVTPHVTTPLRVARRVTTRTPCSPSVAPPCHSPCRVPANERRNTPRLLNRKFCQQLLSLSCSLAELVSDSPLQPAKLQDLPANRKDERLTGRFCRSCGSVRYRAPHYTRIATGRSPKSPISPYIYGIGKGDGMPLAAVMTACWGPAGDTPGTVSKRFKGSLDVVAARVTSQPSEFQALRRSVPVEPCAVVRSAGRDDRRMRLDEFHIGVVE